MLVKAQFHHIKFGSTTTVSDICDIVKFSKILLYIDDITLLGK